MTPGPVVNAGPHSIARLRQAVDLRLYTLRRRLGARLRRRPPATLLGAHHDRVHKHDDIQAIRGRVDQSTVDHVVLRVPPGNRTLASPLGMRLLRLHAEARGVVLIIETRSRGIRAYARDQGLTAVASVRTRELYQGRLRSRRRGIGAFALLARLTLSLFLVLAALTALVLLIPQTTVRIAPELSIATITVPVEARVPAGGEDLPPGILPARRFSTIVAYVDRARSSGIVETPDTNARGEVRFSNHTDDIVHLPAGTIVSAISTTTSAGLDFRTRAPVTLPAPSDTPESAATETVPSVTVEVEAAAPGPRGNLPAGSITGVEPGLAERVSVVNPRDLTGGTTRSARAPTVQDQDALRAGGIERIRERGLDQLAALSAGAFVFHQDSARVAIQEERFDPPLGGVGADVEIALQASVTVIGVDLALLQRLAAEAISAPATLAAFIGDVVVVPQSVALRAASAARYDPATGTIRFDMLVDGVVVPVIGESQVKGTVQWKSASAAELALAQQFALRTPAQVRVSPGLMPRTALFGFRVKVEIDVGVEPQPSPPDSSPTLAGLPVAG